MNAFLDPTRVHRGRTRRCIAINLDEESLSILRSYCPQGSRHLGEFVSRLLVEKRARDEERAQRQSLARPEGERARP